MRIRSVIPIAFIFTLLGLSYLGEQPKYTPPCKYTGMDKIEYGLWVTNCGDTIRKTEAREFNKRYYDKSKN